MPRFHEGEHVQWRFRSGTRAGFVEKVLTSQDDAQHAGARGQAREVNPEHPAYLIHQEKEGTGPIVKLEDRLEPVHEPAGMSHEEIVDRDKKVKRSKRSGAHHALDAEPQANKASKARLSGRSRQNAKNKSSDQGGRASRTRKSHRE